MGASQKEKKNNFHAELERNNKGNLATALTS